MIKMNILQNHAAWLEARSHYIGGSDAAAVLGLNPYKSNLELWQEKTGLVVPEDISEKPYVKYGHAAEAAGYPAGGDDGELDPGDCPVLRL